MSIGQIVVAILVVIEIYYWGFWLPRNWKSNREARDFVHGMKTVYGKKSSRN